MDRYTCPSCGGRYNGKRCRHCSYEHFSEEIAHGNHTHHGEPLVIDAPTRKPIPKKNPFGCDKKTRKKHPFAGFLVLLALINSLMPMLRDWGLELEAREDAAFAAIKPEPMPALPEDGTTLYDRDGLLIFAEWEDGREFPQTIPVIVRNTSRSNYEISTRDVTVNGFLINGGLYCDSRKNSYGKETFYLNVDSLARCGITQVHTVSFYLDIYDSNTYDILDQTEVITFTARVPEGFAQPTDLGALPLWEEDGLKIDYLGYLPNPYVPEEFCEGTLEFYIENQTDERWFLYPEEFRINGEWANLSFSCELPPRTRSLVTVYLYNLENSGYTKVQDLKDVEVTIVANSPDTTLFLPPILLPNPG